MTQRVTSAVGLFALAGTLCGTILLACAPDERPETSEGPSIGQPVPGEEAPVPHDSEIAAHMGEHFWQLAIAQDAAIEGDLDALREAAGWMAEHDPVEGLPAGAAPHLQVLRARSLRAAGATDLTTATAELGFVAASCGACHQALEVALPTVIEEDLDPGDNLRGQMSAHIRAADLMWEALVAPSDLAWEAGAELLGRVEIMPDAVSEGPEDFRLVSELLGRLNEIATASTQATAGDRPVLYGELLSTCGQCHDALGRGFQPGN